MRELHPQPVARLAGFAGPDRIRKNDVVAARIQRLAAAEQFSAQLRGKKTPAGTSRTMQHENRIADVACRIAFRRAESDVMEAQLREFLAGLEREAGHIPVAFKLLRPA